MQIVTGRRRLRFHQPSAPGIARWILKWVTMEGSLEKGMSQTIILSTILSDGCFRAGIDKLCLGDQIQTTACFCKTCKLRMDIGCRLLVPSLNQGPRAKAGQQVNLWSEYSTFSNLNKFDFTLPKIESAYRHLDRID